MESKFLSSSLVFCSAILRTFILFSIQVLILIFWQSIQILSVQYDFTLELWCSETINWWALFSQSSFPALWPTIQSANWTSSTALLTSRQDSNLQYSAWFTPLFSQPLAFLQRCGSSTLFPALQLSVKISDLSNQVLFNWPVLYSLPFYCAMRLQHPISKD